MNPLFRIDFSISDSLKIVRKSVLIYETIIRCPVCGNKTRTMIRENTELKNFPLYCPKCKQETLVNVKNTQLSVIRLNNLIFEEDNKL